jgi:zinc transport system substrate-binding protein
MKKVFALFSALILVFVGCSSEGALKNESGKLNVIATIFPLFDFARNIAGSESVANVQMLIPPATEIHDFEPTPKDIIAIEKCDVFIYVGGESDEWVEKILENITDKTEVIKVIDCVETLDEEFKDGMQGEAEEETAPDEHVWTSPLNAELICNKIADGFCKKDAENADVYNKNLAEYSEKLTELDGEFENLVKNSARKTLIFADRFPLRYFTERYGLDYFAAFPGCSSETEPNMKTVKFLIDKVKSEEIPIILHMELSSPKMAESIAKETSAKILQINSCHNLTKEEFDEGASYLSLMRKNVEVLRAALC